MIYFSCLFNRIVGLVQGAFIAGEGYNVIFFYKSKNQMRSRQITILKNVSSGLHYPSNRRRRHPYHRFWSICIF